MSRRSSRRIPANKNTASQLPSNVERGLASLVEGNEDLIASMLSIDLTTKTKKTCDENDGDDDGDDNDNDNNNNKRKRKRLIVTAALTDCMRMNNLSSEALLARFFDSSVLGKYCIDRLKVSGKGNEATLAARIGRKWSKPDFEAIAIATVTIIEKEKDDDVIVGVVTSDAAAKKKQKNQQDDYVVGSNRKKNKNKNKNKKRTSSEDCDENKADRSKGIASKKKSKLANTAAAADGDDKA